MPHNQLKYQTKQEFTIERVQTEKYYSFLGDEQAGPRYFMPTDKNDESIIPYNMVYLAIKRDKDNLQRAYNAISAHNEFRTYLAENGLGLQILNADDEALNQTNGALNGNPWNQNGQEIKLIIPLLKPLKPEETKKCMLTLLKILVDAGVQLAIPPTSLIRTPNERDRISKLHSIVSDISEQLIREKKFPYSHIENGTHIISHSQGVTQLVSVNLPRAEKNILLPFSYMVTYMQVHHHLGLSSDKKPTEIIDIKNYGETVVDLCEEIQFSRADLLKEGLSETTCAAADIITKQRINEQSEEIDEIIHSITKQLKASITDAKKNAPKTEKNDESDSLDSRINQFYNENYIVCTGDTPPASIFNGLKVTHQVKCLRADVLHNQETLKKFNKSIEIRPLDYEDRFSFEEELRTRFEPFFTALRTLNKIDPFKANAWFNVAVHFKKVFLDTQALTIKHFQLNTPQKSKPVIPEIKTTKPEIETINLSKTTTKRVFPETYELIWKNKENKTALVSTKNLLRDYVKGGFWGRLFTCHLGRHHTEAVANVLKRNDLFTVQAVVNAVIDELNKNPGVTLNPNGSLARRLAFVAQKTNSTIPEVNAVQPQNESLAHRGMSQTK